ncbi:MAG: LPS export ABC transporter periplasmic protein LptC [Nitrospinales bacterium]
MALSLIAVSGYYLYSDFSPAKLPAKILPADSLADVEIKKFKVVHENLGRKDWELKADHAEINHQKNVTHLRNVEVEFFMENDQQFRVSADTGVLKNNTKAFELEGNVRLIAEQSLVFGETRARPVGQTADN